MESTIIDDPRKTVEAKLALLKDLKIKLEMHERFLLIEQCVHCTENKWRIKNNQLICTNCGQTKKRQ